MPPAASLVLGGLVVLGTGALFGPCFRTGLPYGIWTPQCPTGELRLGLNANLDGVIRGDEGWVTVRPEARFLLGRGSDVSVERHTLTKGVEVKLALLDLEDQPVPGFEVKKWEWSGDSRRFEVVLPELPDGDYVLRVTAEAGFETQTLDLPVPLYAPALSHVVTDRPLYKPGQQVLLRSVMLKQTDLTPLDGRPGRWVIRSPRGEQMMVEKDKAGAYGVADSSFPLDARADVGTWTARWESGGSSDEVSFEVRPFKLPRFTVEMSASERWYHISDTLAIEGTARYTSGAPIANAPVQVRLSVAEGRWPLPLDWEETFEAKTDREGRFELEIGDVPPEKVLEREKIVLSATATVTEAAGERATGGTRLILSQDDIAVEAVTELGDGLVGSFNNRAYLRVTTPDGRPLPGAKLAVANPWDPTSKPQDAETDADGVAAIQVDPGDPVSIPIPGPPTRVRPVKIPDPYLASATELGSSRSLDLPERRAVDRVIGRVAPCGDFAPGGRQVSLGVQVGAGGYVRRVMSGGSELDACVASATRAIAFPAGPARTYQLTWQVPDTLRPSLQWNHRVAYGDAGDVQSALAEAAVSARRCLPQGAGHPGAEVASLHWTVSKGSTFVEVQLDPPSGSTGLTTTQLGCVRSRLQVARLDEPADAEAMGVAKATLNVPNTKGRVQGGQTTYTTGYELSVQATSDGADLGKTRKILPVGAIPSLRLRATPSLAKPGDTVVVEALRGPDFRGELPKKLVMWEGTRAVSETEKDKEKSRWTFQIPEDVDGFLHVETHGARVVVLSRRPDPLSVSLSTDAPVYEPGATAKLTVQTKAGGQGVPAGVGLIGVDSTLGQLAPLVGPDDYGRVTVRTEADNPAFGSFDPRALTLGQVRGENAAKAALLRISSLPQDYAGDQRTYGGSSTTDDDLEVLTRHFYRVLEQLVSDVRAWERSAPDGEVMQPDRMVRMWDEARDKLGKSGEMPADAYGRPLELTMLPADLLAQVDPRQVVAEGTRLPEDVIGWQTYIDEEVR